MLALGWYWCPRPGCGLVILIDHLPAQAELHPPSYCPMFGCCQPMTWVGPYDPPQNLQLTVAVPVG